MNDGPPASADLETTDFLAQRSRLKSAGPGQQLRAMYNDVVGQGIPERFAELLKQIADAAAEKPKQSGAGG
jgi:hypothetical protein